MMKITSAVEARHNPQVSGSSRKVKTIEHPTAIDSKYIPNLLLLIFYINRYVGRKMMNSENKTI